MKKIVQINNTDDWKLVKEQSSGVTELIIYKHSPICGTSSLCEQLLNKWFENISGYEHPSVVKIDVLASRPLSNFIADEFNIIHESPQVIWLDKNGKVKWHNSHLFITEKALTNQLIFKEEE